MDSYDLEIRKIFNVPDGLSIEDCIHSYADPSQVLLAYSIFFPQFSEIEGEPVLGTLTQEQIRQVKDALKYSPPKEALESFRWTEVPYLFSSRQSLSETQDLILAQLIAKTWDAKLNQQYPHKQWKVQVLSPEITGSVVGVGFNEI